MANKKKAPAKKKMSLRERMANRHRQIDEASGYGQEKKDRKIPLPKKYQ